MRQHLFIDADDTLWENNIYFERAIHAFVEFLAHSSLTPAEVRGVIDEVERTMGYGFANFTKSLVQTYQRLAERDIRDDDVQYIQRLGEQIARQPIQIMEGVEKAVRSYWGKRGEQVVQDNLTCISRGYKEVFEVPRDVIMNTSLDDQAAVALPVVS